METNEINRNQWKLMESEGAHTSLMGGIYLRGGAGNLKYHAVKLVNAITEQLISRHQKISLLEWVWGVPPRGSNVKIVERSCTVMCLVIMLFLKLCFSIFC